ncbi:MAG: hypothetical protein QM734_04030 [Cyclobacteriaceae bacterium]
MKLIFLLLIVSQVAVGQITELPKHRFKVMAEIPVQFGLGYEWQYSKRFSSNFQVGVLTQPNSTIILNTLQALGTSQDVILMLQDAFKFGMVYKGTLNYNFKRNYVGGFFQVIDLTGKDTPTALVETAMGVSISSYPRYPGKNSATPTNLTLHSSLFQAGVLYGRRFLVKKKSEIDLEFGISANVGSSSSVNSDVRDLSSLSKYANTYLASIYKSYAFVPSITIAYAVKIGK